MALNVFLAVLFAAMLHAAWNVLVKSRLDPLVSLTAVAMGCSVIAIPWLFFVPFPSFQTWLFLIASACVHTIYKVFLAKTFSAGELGQVYPIARGSAPLLTLFGAALIAGEYLSMIELAGVVFIILGVVSLSLKGAPSFHGKAVGYALITGLTIATYSLIDGFGARTSGNLGSFIIYLFVLDGGSMALYALIAKGPVQIRETLKVWRLGLLGGCMAMTGYAINLWAMKQAPIGQVAALRESSVLFAVIFGVMFLGEKLNLWRAIAAVFVVTGIALTKI